MALGKEIPATVTRFPSIENAWPAFGLVAGLLFMFSFGYYFLWKWDVLDRQLIIFAACCSVGVRHICYVMYTVWVWSIMNTFVLDLLVS